MMDGIGYLVDLDDRARAVLRANVLALGVDGVLTDFPLTRSE
jgi:hypothetical protein